MAIYGAAFSEPQRHHGTLFSIAATTPINLRITTLDFLVPKPDEAAAGQSGTKRFASRINKPLRKWLESIDPALDITLLDEPPSGSDELLERWTTTGVWKEEKPFAFRTVVIDSIRAIQPKLVGGNNVERIPFPRCPQCLEELIPGLSASYCPQCKRYTDNALHFDSPPQMPSYQPA